LTSRDAARCTLNTQYNDFHVPDMPTAWACMDQGDAWTSVNLSEWDVASENIDA